MPGLGWMQPRDRDEASRTVLTLCSVASFVTLVFSVTQPAGSRTPALSIDLPVLVLLMLGAWLLRRSRGNAPLGWALFPLCGVAVILALDLLSHDASTSAQVFLILPALYGASQLPRAGAVLMTSATLAADLVNGFLLLPPRQALVDCTYVCAALLSCTYLLVRAEERRASLLATLKHQAGVDPLTGLATRRALDDTASTLLDTTAGAALLLVDIDHFKSVNDSYGHLVGDEILCGVGDVLRQLACGEDVISRIGGDEIAILLPACGRLDAVARAREVVRKVRESSYGGGRGLALAITVSVGVAHAPTDAQDLISLYSAADAALYDAKRRGRNCVGALPGGSSLAATA